MNQLEGGVLAGMVMTMAQLFGDTAGSERNLAHALAGAYSKPMMQGRAFSELSVDAKFLQVGQPITRGISLAARSLREAVISGDQLGTARALNNLAFAFTRAGNYAAAHDCNHMAVEGFVDLWEVGAAETGSVHPEGPTEERQVDYERARSYLERLLSEAELRGDKELVGGILGCLGNLHLEFGRIRDALSCHYKQLAAHAILCEPKAMAMSLMDVGLLHARIDEHDVGRTQLERAVVLCDRMGDALGVARSLSRIGRIETLRRRHWEALELELEALVIREGLADKRAKGESLLRLAEIHCNLGKYECSETAFRSAVTTFRRTNAQGMLKRAELGLKKLGRKMHAMTGMMQLEDEAPAEATNESVPAAAASDS